MSKLSAGAAYTDITPRLGTSLVGYFHDRKAQDVADPLLAKAVVLENDETSIAFVMCDVIVLVREDVDPIKQRASELTGIPPQNIMICATHTHTGPATRGALGIEDADDIYMSWAPDKIADSIKLAQNRLQPAVLGHISGSVPEETYNRRWWMKDGTVQMNPGYENPNKVKPAGPTDPEVAILAIQTPDREPIAVIANYSLHYVGGPFDLSVSADYFECFATALQRMAGAEFVAIMANGCCGDINNWDFTRPAPQYPYPHYQCDRVANVLAAETFKKWNQIHLEDYLEEVTLAAALTELPVRRRELSPEDLAAAQAVLDNPADYGEMEQVYAREAIEVDKLPLEQNTWIGGLRIADLAIAGLPGEIFVQIGLEIKEKSPFARTMTVELANDWVGYVPTDEAFGQGGYETRLARSARVAPGTGPAMVNTTLELLNQLAD